MKKAIGIDLGTTNSVVAFKDTAVKIVRNKENEELTRSCVGMRKGEFIVGSTAYNDIKRDPINTILSVKRLMGGAIKDDMVQAMIKSTYYNFGITSLQGGTDDAVALVLGGKQFTPEQISAEILKKMKSDAEEKLGDEVTHAVITVPAYFTERQKNATRIAAQLAGLKVQKLLAEPTAAAIAYGVDNLKPGDSKTVLIYDFGGGTFDLSILNIVDGQYMEAGTSGDRWLGGDDIDRKLQSLVLEKLAVESKIKDIKKLIGKLSEKKRFLFEGEIRLQTEAAKIQLSSAKTAQILIDNILEDENGDIIDIEITITKIEFEQLVIPFIERSIELIELLLKEVGYDIIMIDNILLVGGTSCIPLIKQKLSEKFGANKIKITDKPMLAIAEGAAILSHRLGDDYEAAVEDNTAIREISYSTNHSYFIEIEEGDIKKMERVIEKQMPLPIQMSRNFKTTTNNQKIVKVSIFCDVENGENERQVLGFYLIEQNLPINSELTFDFNLDINENLSIHVAPKGKKNLSKQIVLGRGGADHRALESIDELITKSIKEYKTIEGEEAFLSYVSQKIKDIESKGAAGLEDATWHEIYYKTTEEYEIIKKSEKGNSDVDKTVYRAMILINEFGELLEPLDKKEMMNLIAQIESSDDEFEKIQLSERLKRKKDEYGLLNLALRLESLADRILNVQRTPIGVTNKQADVNKVLQLSAEIKTKFKMHQIDAANALMDEAYAIIDKYKDSI